MDKTVLLPVVRPDLEPGFKLSVRHMLYFESTVGRKPSDIVLFQKVKPLLVHQVPLCLLLANRRFRIQRQPLQESGQTDGCHPTVPGEPGTP